MVWTGSLWPTASSMASALPAASLLAAENPSASAFLGVLPCRRLVSRLIRAVGNVAVAVRVGACARTMNVASAGRSAALMAPSPLASAAAQVLPSKAAVPTATRSASLTTPSQFASPASSACSAATVTSIAPIRAAELQRARGAARQFTVCPSICRQKKTATRDDGIGD